MTEPTSNPALQNPQQLLAEARAAKDRGDLKAHADLLAQATARYQADYPEPDAHGGDQAGERPPTYEPPVPLTEAQQAIAQDFAADVHGLDVPNVSVEQKGAFLDFALAEALQDTVNTRDEAQAMTVLRTRHGGPAEALVDDARRAVQALGPQVKDYLERTGAGNSPGVIQALALWQRGAFKVSPQEARQRMISEQDPALRRLLGMLAARS